MWMNRKTGSVFLKTLNHVLNVLKFSTNVRTQPPRKPGPSRPPWSLLFFGTDQFAVESLKVLTSCRNPSKGIVEKLEVVSLPGDLPVRRFAQQNQLTLHNWPPHDLEGQFDVGVVVSFGRLIHGGLIDKFPFGILNVHPSLLPRWRGPAPVFHTIMHGDTVTGVTIIQIRPNKFDVGPILNQELHKVQKNCTAEELGAALATKGAHLLIDTLMKLPEKIANKREQGMMGVTFAPKINTSMSWIHWEEQTCNQIACLCRAIGCRIPLRTIWMGKTIKLLDFVGKCHTTDQRNQKPGSVYYDKVSNTLAVCCKVCITGRRNRGAYLERQKLAGELFLQKAIPGRT
ncbi:methionyl-tRNA formyltransferase, mitochondrial isoform X3 [Girardinichthys multiradiatus]|uniref:methionyl-tRNA formyltransferase, mitochondrial isoform X3 n=1 Tax=Girardinichthys multiradiatus TaxID=208333 RepID=UPI001FAD4651|nr:methionyl-tRNA formyltransferase, mitochondrial isoform X3 [Girardinichthys multiradiatus]